ncbi:putative ribosomal protein S13 [Rosa chinensis]|uniref:Putative ribosomal protein S13 n=2 Tax=Rosa chinensis TaxID=74649 RepID=A0A2P6SBF2_ROSCH|nr:putative ribosomal protein S13 [Rosa chinensis]
MFALTSIKGIGRHIANIVCKKDNVDMNRRDMLGSVELQEVEGTEREEDYKL